MNKYSWFFIVFVILVVGLRVGNEITSNIAFILVIGYALLGKVYAIQALVLLWLISNLSPGITPETRMIGFYRYAVFFSSFASVFLIYKSKTFITKKSKIFIWCTVGLGVLIILHSLIISPIPDVSILKGLSWTIVVATIISGWISLSDTERTSLTNRIYWLLVAVLIVSIPLIVTSLGYLRNGTGFQGIMNHPQVFGSAMAILGAWTTGIFFSRKKPGWFLVILIVTSLILVIMSEARTAGVSLVLGVGLSLVFSPIFAGTSFFKMAPGFKSPRIWMVLFLAFSVGIYMSTEIGERAQHFITKSDRADVDGLIGAYEASRGGGVKLMWYRFLQSPITGHGFGISSFPNQMVIVRDPIFNMPLSASVEKGVTYLAILEELGIIVGLLVFLWLFFIIKGCAKSGLTQFAICLTILLINMGEATLFSPGGVGLLYLILIGLAFSSGLKRKVND